VLIDPAGTLWVTGRDRIFFLRAGDTHFTETRVGVTRDTSLARGADGTLWVTDRTKGVRALPGLSTANFDTDYPAPPNGIPLVDGARLLFDSQGRMWGTDHSVGGLFMVENPAAIAPGSLLHENQITTRFGSDIGLTSDQASPLFEDLEHNVWVGTNFGLDSFRHANVATLRSIAANPGVLFSVAVDPKGDVWVASGTRLYRWVEGELKLHATFPRPIFHLLADPTGGLWYDTEGALARWRDGRTYPVGLPSEAIAASLTAEAPDGEGGLWAAFQLRGIYHFSRNQWRLWDPQIPGAGDATAMATTKTGTLWIGFPGNRALSFDGRSRRHYSAGDGLQLGSALSFSATDNDVLIGGETGLAWNISGRFQSTNALGDLPIAGVSGIARDSSLIWLNTSRGVIRIASTELRRALTSPSYVPTFRLFDPHDGLPGIALQTAAAPTAQLDGKGRIWLETNKGIAMVDPGQIRSNQIAPHVVIRFVETDSGRFDSQTPIELPQLTSRVRIAYTATSLSVPERVRFRYRLDRVDGQWQEAGNRREAFYTNLKPGAYYFRVMAANEDGVWNQTGAGLAFSIAPAYYQTWWFHLFCVVAVLILVAAYLLLRLRRYAAELRRRLEERHFERHRIARDLHDTLLQSVHGLMLRLQSAVSQIPTSTPARRMLDEAIDNAEKVILEGRDRVSELRAESEGLGDLPSAIRGVGESLASIHGFSFDLNHLGTPRELRPLVADECFSIAREALVNAAQHSQARNLGVTVEFNRMQLVICIKDDGIGITPGQGDVMAHNHFGITGMHERAATIGAALDIVSVAGKGVCVTLRVPAKRSYKRGAWRSVKQQC
jgi:signal transduction histidine kinase